MPSNCRRAIVTAALGAAFACNRLPSRGIDDAGPAALAASDMSPAKKPPALRVTHPTTPPLPDLPALASHEAPATAPPDAGLDDNPCHAVWTGSQAAPLACAHALLFGPSSGGAVTLVPRKLLARDLSALPASVDHRQDGTEGPLRNQGSAPACTAFATATAIDHALARWGGRNPAVSVMQIWSRYHSPDVATSLASNVGQALGAEQAWPFNVTEAVAWVPCDQFPKPPSGGCGKRVDDARLRAVEGGSVGEFTEVEYLSSPPDISVLQAKLAAGQDVMVTMELPKAFVPKGRAGARYIPNYTKSAGPDAGHALVLAGYVHLPHGVYFLIHNSWGPSWGDAGICVAPRGNAGASGRARSWRWTPSRRTAHPVAVHDGIAARRPAPAPWFRTASPVRAPPRVPTAARGTTAFARSQVSAHRATST